MFVDTHMHEMTCSKDSFLKLEERKVSVQSASRTMMIWD